MPNVAILGGPGSGKTVLLTVLAQRFRKASLQGPWLEERTKETMAFTRTQWQHLSEEHEWPLLTPPGALHNLQWCLHSDGNAVFDLQVQDYAGEVYRQAFGGDDSPPAETKPGADDEFARARELANQSALALRNYVKSADTVLILINLQDVIDANDGGRALEDEYLPRATLQYIAQHNPKSRRVVVLTQADQYRSELAEHGSWRAVCQEHLMQLLEAGRVTDVLAVSAVADTQVVCDKENPLGLARPAPGFRSEGLDELLTWLTQQTLAKQRAKRWRLTAVVVALTLLLLAIAYGVVHIWQQVRERQHEKERMAVQQQQEREQAEALRAFQQSLQNAIQYWDYFRSKPTKANYERAKAVLPKACPPNAGPDERTRYDKIAGIITVAPSWISVPQSIDNVGVLAKILKSDRWVTNPCPYLKFGDVKIAGPLKAWQISGSIPGKYSPGTVLTVELWDEGVFSDDKLEYLALTLKLAPVNGVLESDVVSGTSPRWTYSQWEYQFTVYYETFDQRYYKP